MKKDFGPLSLIFPEPVLILGSYDGEGNADAMNAAWGGIHDTNQIGICLALDHKSTENILLNKEFTVSFATADRVKECDYVGIVSANQVPDKVSWAGFTVQKAEHVNAPCFDQLPVYLECKMVSFDEASGYLVADIVNVCADESVLTDGKIDPFKFKPIIFDGMNHKYMQLGEVVGTAFKEGQALK